jgi:hypothetical protein
MEMNKERRTTWVGLLALMLPLLLAALLAPSGAKGAAEPVPGPPFFVFLPMVQNPPPWTDCSENRFGTMLVDSPPGEAVTPASVMLHAEDQFDADGIVGAGAPSARVRDEWFGRLPGWTRLFVRGTYAELEYIHQAATVFGMTEMYECFGYGPESAHRAGEEALDPTYWVPLAEARAEAAGKCLVYGPALLDYERLSTPDGQTQPDMQLLADLIGQVAPHVDVWLIQLAKYQRWADAGQDDDGNPFSRDDFRNWIGWWVSQIEAANPEAQVWTQLGIGKYDPIEEACQPPQWPTYILAYRELLYQAGVRGVWVMPSMPCQNSLDPQDREYYVQALTTLQEAIDLACGQ